MATSIVCVSDCHLGYRHRFKTRRLEDYQRSFEEALDKALSLKPEVIVFGGDLVHHPTPDPKTLRVLLQGLLKAAEKTHVILSIGNHEISGHLGTTYSPIYADLHKRIHVLSTETPHVTLNVRGKRVGFHGFQFIRNRKVAEATLQKISSELEGNDLNVLCMHQAVEKYLAPYEISLRTLREVASKYNLILNGHVHKHQRINEVFDVTPAYYIGSTERVSFNEWQNPTGILVFRDFDFSSPEHVSVSSSSMKYVRESLGVMAPAEVNRFIESVIDANRGVSMLQINVDVSVEGDYLDVKHDWYDRFPGYTILDVSVTPLLTAKAVTIEKIELNQDLIREYFEKTGVKENDFVEFCVELYQRYGA